MNENSGVQFQRWNCFSLHLSLSISRSQVREEACSPAFSWVPFWALRCSQEERPVLFLLWKVGVTFWLMHALLGRAEVLGQWVTSPSVSPPSSPGSTTQLPKSWNTSWKVGEGGPGDMTPGTHDTAQGQEPWEEATFRVQGGRWGQESHQTVCSVV